MFKKIVLRFLLVFAFLLLLVVVAANSSYVIKKLADSFAPAYKISYDDIHGNVFTGVIIDGLKYDEKDLSKRVTFSWNPSKILYLHVAVNKVEVDEFNVDTLKELISSFPKSEKKVSETKSEETSSFLPIVITLGRASLTLLPFSEQGIRFEKTELNLNDLSFSMDSLSVDEVILNLDSNVSKIHLQASLIENVVNIKELNVENIDSLALEHILIKNDNDVEKGKKEVKKEVKKVEKEKAKSLTNKDVDEINPFMPTSVTLDKSYFSLKPRVYKNANIDIMEIHFEKLSADINKIFNSERSAIDIATYSFDFKSDIGQIDLLGNLKNDTLTVENLLVHKLDTIALQELFANPNNDANTTKSSEQNSTDNNSSTGSEKVKSDDAELNPFIPKNIVVEKIEGDILPSKYEPLDVDSFTVDVKNVHLDVSTMLVEKGEVNFSGKTNLSQVSYKSNIKDNNLKGELSLLPTQKLFDLYAIPLSSEALGELKVSIDATPKKVNFTLNKSAKQILIVTEDDNVTDEELNEELNATDEVNSSEVFNVDLNKLSIEAVYSIIDNTFHSSTKVVVSTPYGKNISFNNNINLDENLTYDGNLLIPSIDGVDARLVKPIGNFELKYSGDTHSIKSKISSNDFVGSFDSPNFVKGRFVLKTKKALAMSKIVDLPDNMKETKASLLIDLPFDFSAKKAEVGKVKLDTSLVNIDSTVLLGKDIEVKAVTTVPKSSPLRAMDKNVHYSAISPMQTNVKISGDNILFSTRSSKLFLKYNTKKSSTGTKGEVILAGLKAGLTIDKKGQMRITTNVDSFSSLGRTVNEFYTVKDLPKVDGALNLELYSRTDNQVVLNIKSPLLIYHADRRTDHLFNDVALSFSTDNKVVRMEGYTFSYNKMNFFSTKPALVTFKDNVYTIKEIWINDELKVTGDYDISKNKANIYAKADVFDFSHEMIDLSSKIDITTKLDGNNTDIKGEVQLFKGDLHYDINTKTFPSDSDIKIVQEMKKEEASPMMDNMTIAVNINTKEPVVFKDDVTNINANVNLGIHKAKYSDPLIIGSVDLVDGGSYIFQGKKFYLEQSHIYFTGDATKPILDLQVKYKSMRHLITISITGTPSMPNVLFSSVPSLSKEQILSLILFDSEDGAGTNSGDDMMKMMGGAMAKSALSNFGIKLDHLVFGEGNSVEVGKKISDKVTVIYINGDIPEMKIKYDYSPTMEAVVGASERSESVDFIYKKDFSEDDIVIFGR